MRTGAHKRDSIPFAQNSEATGSLGMEQASLLSCSLLGAAQLDTLEHDLAELAASCECPNPFWMLAFLRPALKMAVEEQPVMLLCVREGEQLIGFLPVVYARGFAKTPFLYLKNWMHSYCFMGAPLVRGGCELQFTMAIHHGLSTLSGGPKFLRMEQVPTQNNLVSLADDEQAGQGLHCSGKIERPALVGNFDFADHMKNGISSKKRGDLGRLSRRLNEIGPVDYQIMAEDDDPDRWSEDFLALEHKGWKGQAGTSMASREGDRKFFIQMIKEMSAKRRLVFQKMMVGARIAAMSVNFLHEGRGYGFKSCFEEDFAQFSPGVLASLRLLDDLSNQAGLQFFDTCSSPGQSMLQRYWPHQRSLVGVTIGSNSLDGRMAILLCRYAERASSFKRR